MMADAGLSSGARRVLMLAGVVLLVTVIYFARELLIPLTLAALASFLLAPAVRAVERLGIGRTASVSVVVMCAFLAMAGLGWFVAKEAGRLLGDLPQHRERIVSKIRDLRETVPGALSRASETVAQIGRELTTPEVNSTDGLDSAAAEPGADSPAPAPVAAGTIEPQPPAIGDAESGTEPVKVEIVPPRPDLAVVLATILGPLVHPLLAGAVTIVFLVFFLLHREDLRDRLIRLGGRAHINITTSALADVGERITSFVLAQTLANGLAGLAIGIGLFVMGVPNALLWGLLTAVLRFVPFLGPIVATIFPVALSFAIFESAWMPVLVLGWCLLVDISIGNIFEPWYSGPRVGASPTAVISGFIFWGWLWGAIGVLLATPILVCLIVLGKHVPAFEIFCILLADEPALEPELRFYQRLLAKDEAEAVAIVTRHAKTTSTLKTYDEVVLPALAQLESDRRNGLLDEPRVDSARHIIQQILRSLDADLGASPDGAPEPATSAKQDTAAIMCLIDHGAYDGTVCEMAQRLLGGTVSDALVIPRDALASEIVELIQERQPRALLVVAVGPQDLTRIQHIAKRLAAAVPQVRVVVGLFSSPNQRLYGTEKLKGLPNASLFRSMQEVLVELKRLMSNGVAWSSESMALQKA
jgi:predicted PurR-regulated permease PerM